MEKDREYGVEEGQGEKREERRKGRRGTKEEEEGVITVLMI